MSQIKIDSEDIATIRGALQVIQVNADIVISPKYCKYEVYPDVNCHAIIEQVKRIDKLLPVIKFERGK